MRVWVEDLKYHLFAAMRAVGIGLIAVGWASALGSEAQQANDIRAYLQVLAALFCLIVVHVLTGLPPSWTLRGLLDPLARDISAVARERNMSDAWIRAAAARRIRRGANVPRDRRAWLSRLAELYQARD